MRKARSTTWLAVVLMLATAALVLPRASQAQDKTLTVVHLGQGTNDLHSVTMGLSIATALAKRPGSTVTLFLDREGVRVADRRTPGDLRWGTSPTLDQLFAGFVAAGGDVLVCPHCAQAVGLGKDDLRKGAKIGTEDEVASRMLAADRILDY
jgi:predicted peroxiredoxin